MYDDYTVIAYGCGDSFHFYMRRLDQVIDIAYFSDKNHYLWNKNVFFDHRICISPDKMKKLPNPFVIIMIDERKALLEVCKFLDQERIAYKHARELLNGEIGKGCMCQSFGTVQGNRLHKFIDVSLSGTTACNFHCEYCVIWRNTGFHGKNELSEHSVEELCEGFSATRVGGLSFINLCARGETLLAKGIVRFTEGLLQEGHYVSIVTNATINKTLDELLSLSDSLLERLFFKISFHYKELKRLKLFDSFWGNVEKIKESKCSYTLEMVPDDDLEPLMEEIKEMCEEKAGGIMPHLTFARDSTKPGNDLLSACSVDEYRRKWGRFSSALFDLKSEWYGRNMRAYDCYAGSWSYTTNAMTGDIKACYRREVIGNIFDKEMKIFPSVAVGKDCCIEYCFNNHAFLAWGTAPEIECASYLDMRDKVSKAGEHWVKEPMYRLMVQKLKDNNFEYLGKWADYERLYARGRKKAIILFNSPDYPNLGDHAIALAERQFFEEHFPEYGFIEISCTQYERESVKIKGAIQKEDVLLITGGGNSGDFHLRIQDIISQIIQEYSDNKIIVGPQTMYFVGDAYSEMEKEHIRSIYKSHPHLFLTAREHQTADLYDTLFGRDIKRMEIPDIAFLLKYEEGEITRRHGALVCLRQDREHCTAVKRQEIFDVLENCNLSAVDYSTLSDTEVTLDNRMGKVRTALETIASAQVVVTDRLHCMIFCVVTDTPCVVFNNKTGKVFRMTKWIEECQKVARCEKLEDCKAAIQKVMTANVSNENILAKLWEMFDEYAEFLKMFLIRQEGDKNGKNKGKDSSFTGGFHTSELSGICEGKA